MNIEFLTNDYLLAWNLLFKPSFCEETQKLKEKLWQNFPKQYMKMERLLNVRMLITNCCSVMTLAQLS